MKKLLVYHLLGKSVVFHVVVRRCHLVLVVSILSSTGLSLTRARSYFCVQGFTTQACYTWNRRRRELAPSRSFVLADVVSFAVCVDVFELVGVAVICDTVLKSLT